jgi:hypothetical protein
MEICLLLLPIAVLLALGWTHFPAMTILFLGYLMAFGLRFAVRTVRKGATVSRG